MTKSIFPTICDDCERILAQDVESGGSGGYLYCNHTGMLAMVSAHMGKVTGYTLDGPMSELIAKRRVEDVIRHIQLITTPTATPETH